MANKNACPACAPWVGMYHMVLLPYRPIPGTAAGLFNREVDISVTIHNSPAGSTMRLSGLANPPPSKLGSPPVATICQVKVIAVGSPPCSRNAMIQPGS